MSEVNSNCPQLVKEQKDLMKTDPSHTAPNWHARFPRRPIVVRDPKTGATRVVSSTTHERQQPSLVSHFPSHRGRDSCRRYHPPVSQPQGHSPTNSTHYRQQKQKPSLLNLVPHNHSLHRHGTGQVSMEDRSQERFRRSCEFSSFSTYDGRRLDVSESLTCNEHGVCIDSGVCGFGNDNHDDGHENAGGGGTMRLEGSRSPLQNDSKRLQGTRIITGYRGRRIVVRDPSFRTNEFHTASKSLRVMHGGIHKPRTSSLRRPLAHRGARSTKELDAGHSRPFYRGIGYQGHEQHRHRASHDIRFGAYSERRISLEQEPLDSGGSGNRDIYTRTCQFDAGNYSEDLREVRHFENGGVKRGVNFDGGVAYSPNVCGISSEGQDEAGDYAKTRGGKSFTYNLGEAGGANPSCVVYVNNLSEDVTTTGLADLFGMVGAVKELRLLYDREGNPSGSADIIFHRPSDALEAIRSLHRVPLNNRPMHLSLNPCIS